MIADATAAVLAVIAVVITALPIAAAVILVIMLAANIEQYVTDGDC